MIGFWLLLRDVFCKIRWDMKCKMLMMGSRFIYFSKLDWRYNYLICIYSIYNIMFRLIIFFFDLDFVIYFFFYLNNFEDFFWEFIVFVFYLDIILFYCVMVVVVFIFGIGYGFGIRG